MTRLTRNRYGKCRVRLLKVSRGARRHDLTELTASIALEGEFARAYTHGDNSAVLPTDSMKNAAYALAHEHSMESIESFALDLARYFLDSHEPVSTAEVELAETRWSRMAPGGEPHPHAFVRGSDEQSTCVATAQEAGARVESGIRDLVMLKTTASAFSGFARDTYTTLAETRDRPLATSVRAAWSYLGDDVDHATCRDRVRDALVQTFAHHASESVQHTLHAMGKAVLAAAPQVARISLTLPNKHCLLVDLSPFGRKNDNQIFMPTDEPHGCIEATIER